MSTLAPNYFDRRFDDLLDIGRSRLPSLAPGWTDHNLHDPGITLLELLAWVTEAQMYSLSRMRRDERAAYAALFGLAPRGPRAASGYLWLQRLPGSSALGYTRSLVLDAGALVHPEQSDSPAYRTVRKQLWVAGQVGALYTRLADGRVLEHSATNERGNVLFLPFGERAGARDVLAIDIVCPVDGGLFPARRADADGAVITIGVRADATSGAADAAGEPLALAVTLASGAARHALPVVDDSTDGFMRSGALVLDVSGVAGSPRQFTLEIRAERGFARPPRVSRIDLNVIAVRQGRLVARELHIASGLPDQLLRLRESGLEFDAAGEPVMVEVAEDGALHAWRRRPGLADSLPADRVFALDTAQGSICFGNGVNGRIVPPGAQVLLSYAVNDGAQGNAARKQRWVVRGIDGVYGVNPLAMEGGRNGVDHLDQRREARRRAREEHALVTGADVEAAALALPALEVARAWALAGGANGVLDLVAMRARPAGVEPDDASGTAPETARWLAAVERRLAPRLPLGLRLRVLAPRYVVFGIELRVESADGYQESALQAALGATLQARLALVAAHPGGMQRALGLGVTVRDLAAWVRQVEGVRRVLSLRLFDSAGRALDAVATPRLGLPKLDLRASVLSVRRPAQAEVR
ncbi:putative baseplate assembly protein [Massilia genomosp. 1]|uniref:putative baseplate assembly protein n=1 Tax=Massilia genomosp. 1 TaxID=2609280 RepID=UPI00142494D1